MKCDFSSYREAGEKLPYAVVVRIPFLALKLPHPTNVN
jgi:hypothetical protein